MKLYATIAALGLAVSAIGQSRNDIPENPTSAVSSQYLHDLFWVAGYGWDYKVSPGTLTITARPEFFNPKWAGVTDPADWQIERRWTIKAFKADGTSETKIVKTWDKSIEYNWPAGTLYVFFGYQIIPHHINGEFSTNPNTGCSLGISLQGYGGGHQFVNPIAQFYK